MLEITRRVNSSGSRLMRLCEVCKDLRASFGPIVKKILGCARLHALRQHAHPGVQLSHYQIPYLRKYGPVCRCSEELGCNVNGRCSLENTHRLEKKVCVCSREEIEAGCQRTREQSRVEKSGDADSEESDEDSTYSHLISDCRRSLCRACVFGGVDCSSCTACQTTVWSCSECDREALSKPTAGSLASRLKDTGSKKLLHMGCKKLQGRAECCECSTPVCATHVQVCCCTIVGPRSSLSYRWEDHLSQCLASDGNGDKYDDWYGMKQKKAPINATAVYCVSCFPGRPCDNCSEVYICHNGMEDTHKCALCKGRFCGKNGCCCWCG